MNFLDIINQGKNIKYYNSQKFENIDIFEDPEQYIMSYFNNGSKDAVLYIQDSTLLNDRNRCCHMCSLYAFGAYIAQHTKIKQLIEKKYSKLNPKSLLQSSIDNYLYYWFLVSLFHDIGYGNVKLPIVEYDLFDHISSIKKFKYSLHNDLFPNHLIHEILKLFDFYFDKRLAIRTFRTNRVCILNQKLPHIKHFYPNKYYHRRVYYRYLKYDNNRIIEKSNQSLTNEYFEHGIIGGKLLYNNFLLTFKSSLMNCFQVTKEYIQDYNGLIWFPEQLDIIRDLGFIIASHNLWKENFEKYKILDPFKMVNLENPVLFLLCICDTIDPYKFLMKQTNNLNEIKEVLTGININISEQSIIIHSPKILKLNIKLGWYDRLKENLLSYINVEVIMNCDKIVIQL